MSYQQLVHPNLSTVGRIGYCLEYARKCFGAPAVEPTAWQAWTTAQFRHVNAVPTNVSSVQWYSFYQAGINLGHVTFYVPGQGFYSSPWQQGTTHAVLPSLADVERIYGVKYVGWSEDISKVRVIKEETMPSDADIDSKFVWVTGHPATAQDKVNIHNNINPEAYLNSILLQFAMDNRMPLTSAAYVPYTGPQLFIKQ